MHGPCPPTPVPPALPLPPSDVLLPVALPDTSDEGPLAVPDAPSNSAEHAAMTTTPINDKILARMVDSERQAAILVDIALAAVFAR